MRSRTWIALIGLALGIAVVSEVGEAWARARGGGGGGSRGSRSYSAPARPSTPASPTTPSSPSRSLNQPTPASPISPARPSFFGGLMGGIAGFALGGLLGSMLFGGMGHGLGGFGGIGLMDILLIGGGIALLVMFLRRRRAQEPQPAYAGMGGGYRAAEPAPAPTPTATMTAAPVETVSDVERGLSHIAQMDGSFDPNALVANARDVFFDVQTALSARDMSRVREKLTPEMYSELHRQCEELRAAGRTNRVERIDLRRSEVTEAWQESGRDYVTVYLAGSLLDYTVEDAGGAVVAGSATQRENIEEFWTFARPVGPNPWRLSAIQTA
jgi:predicted lipid-binding transport protein (Tim44 family)